jgi:hypothetical protein
VAVVVKEFGLAEQWLLLLELSIVTVVVQESELAE